MCICIHINIYEELPPGEDLLWSFLYFAKAPFQSATPEQKYQNAKH